MFNYLWFETSAQANFETHLARFKDKPNLKFLEVGCFEGRATVWMLENILTAPSSKIHAIDTFEGSVEHTELTEVLTNLEDTFRKNIEPYKEKVVVWKGYSQDVIRRFEPNTRFDFVYVDGSHQAPDVLEDAVLSFRLLNKGGVMIFDDYGWHKYDNRRMNPGMGIDAFIDVFKDKLQVIFKNYQVGIQKL